VTSERWISVTRSSSPGPTARFVDSKDAVNARLPYALARFALVTFSWWLFAFARAA